MADTGFDEERTKATMSELLGRSRGVDVATV
jgi:hypothetical protein